jgi:ABC-2 type transport system permease protein
VNTRLEDVRYTRYDGPRTRPALAIVSLARWSALSALGARKSWRAKFLPVSLALFAFLPAVAVLVLRALFGSRIPQLTNGLELVPYRQYLTGVGVVIMLFAGILTPELLCPDRRDNVLSLYLSTALDRRSYVTGKILAAVVPLLGVTLAPVLLLFIGNTIFAEHALVYLGDHVLDLGRILAAGLLLATYYSLLGLAIASLTTRRAFALGAFAGTCLISTAISGALVFGLGLDRHLQLLGLARIPLVATRSLYPGGDGRENALTSGWWWLAAGIVMLLSLAILARRYSREQP